MTTQEWQTQAEPPGYFGKQREQRHREFDERFGAGNWRLAWIIGERIGPIEEAVMFYEDGYYQFMSDRSELVDELVAAATDVYDDSPSNIDSGLDYSIQETSATHLQDIAIRRCIVRLGRRFEGNELVRIRSSKGEHRLSPILSPGSVPFHRPELIVDPGVDGWWARCSVEDFWQSNKRLQYLAV